MIVRLSSLGGRFKAEADQEFQARLIAIKTLQKVLKSRKTQTTWLPLLVAACGGGGGGGSSSPSPSQPTPAPTPDFTESPTNTFTARDDSNRTLDESANANNLVVTGGGGNDTITTGAGADVIESGAGNDTVTSGVGNDLIWSGEGTDTINAGAGDDIIVVIGTTTDNQYDASSITSPAGVGADLSAILDIADINGQTVSDISGAESIDGGAGNDTLVIYGDVDLSGVTLSNISTLWVNSTLTISDGQLNMMETIVGDGTTILVVRDSDESDAPADIYLNEISVSGIHTIQSPNTLRFIIDDDSELDGIQNATSDGGIVFVINGDGTGTASVNASTLLSFAADINYIELNWGGLFIIDTIEAAQAFSGMQFSGNGTVRISPEVLAEGLIYETFQFNNVLVQFPVEAGNEYLITGSQEFPYLIADETNHRVDFSQHGINSAERYVSVQQDGFITVEIRGSSNFHTFDLSQVDTREPDNDLDIGSVSETSQSLAIDALLTQNISYTNDTDMFAVTLEANTAYIITMSGSDSSGGSLSTASLLGFLEPDGSPVLPYSSYVGLDQSSNNDTSYTFMVSQADTYYFLATGAGSTGTYSITITAPTLTEPDDSPEIGNTLVSARSVTVGDTVSASIGFAQDADWLSFDLVAGELYHFSFVDDSHTSNTYDFSHLFFDADGNPLEGVSYKASENLVYFSPTVSGTYFSQIVALNTGETGTYSFSFELVDTSEPDMGADYAEGIDTRSTFAEGFVQAGNISHNGDVDWHGITTNSDFIYLVSVQYTEADNALPTVTLYDSLGIAPATLNLATQTSNSVSYFTDDSIGSGQFFIAISGGVQSDYTVSYTAISALEPDGESDFDDTSNTRAELEVGADFKGSLSHDLDVDYIAVELLAGQTYEFLLSGDASAGNAISSVNLESIIGPYDDVYQGIEGSDQNRDDTETFTFTAHVTGTYYLVVNTLQPEDESALGASGDYVIASSITGVDEPSGDPDILASIETTATLAMGTTVTGGIGLEYERDWYAVELVAGNVYEFTLLGEQSGVGTLEDPQIPGLYNSDGVLLPGAYNDDGAGNRESLMLFTAPETGTYYIAAGGWDNTTGTYQLSVTDVSSTHTSDLPYGPTNMHTYIQVEGIEPTGNILIDALLGGSRYAGDDSSDFTTITFSIPSVNTFYSELAYGEMNSGFEPWVEFSGLNADQAQWFSDAIDAAGIFTNINFVQVFDGDGSAGTIRAAWTGRNDDDVGGAAWAYLPDAAFTPFPYVGDIWFSYNGIDEIYRDDQNYITYLFMHELGHALGLEHPFEGDYLMPLEYDNHNWTVMAYDYTGITDNDWDTDLFPQTFMYLDILTLGYLYGFAETNHGDTTYTYDGSARYYLTIWDTGGEDTIEVINQSEGVVIDLRGDSWSDVGTTITYFDQFGQESATDDFTIYVPWEVLIENAYGDVHGDILYGNELDNDLRGLGGNDIIYGGEGVDIIDGGAGADDLRGDAGADIFVTRAGDGGPTLLDADLVLDFTDGEDLIGLNGLTYADLTIEEGTGDHAGDTIISETASGDVLMILDNVVASLIDGNDFTTVADDWWLG